MGITKFKIFIWGGYIQKSCITAPLMRHRKTKFPTVYQMIYSPNENFEYSYPLILFSRVSNT